MYIIQKLYRDDLRLIVFYHLLLSFGLTHK